MSYGAILSVLLLFLGGYAGVAAAAHDPTQLIFDWVALFAGLTAAGLAQPDMASASKTRQVATAIGAFLGGYGLVMDSVGFRYVLLHFDWRALLGGMAAAGLVHSNNPNVTDPLKNAAQKLAAPAVRCLMVALAIAALSSCYVQRDCSTWWNQTFHQQQCHG